jgi:hypothetical protein
MKLSCHVMWWSAMLNSIISVRPICQFHFNSIFWGLLLITNCPWYCWTDNREVHLIKILVVWVLEVIYSMGDGYNLIGQWRAACTPVIGLRHAIFRPLITATSKSHLNFCTLWTFCRRMPMLHNCHGLINYIDTQAKCRRNKNWPVKGLCGRFCLSKAPFAPRYLFGVA